VIWILLLALQSAPLDRAVAHLEEGRFEQALRELEQADRKDPRYAKTYDGAVKGVARDLQRAEGYAGALAFLEPRLTSRPIIDHYVEVCIWAGEEDRGLARLRELPPEMDRSSHYAEFQLHWARLDFEALAERAREVEWQEWVVWAQKQQAIRDRFEERTVRGWWVALGAVLAMGAGCFALYRLSPRPCSGARTP
jgi:tetratricopeptide (TPR) repeat protein